MKCYKCNSHIEDHIGFRSCCDNCSSDLHICRTCKFFVKGKPNDCHIPEIDKVVDKDKNNFCEEFVYLPGNLSEKKEKISDVEKKLFGSNEEKKSKNFDDLFKD